MNISKRNNWSQEISETEKLFVNAGLKDIKNGNTFSQELVMEDINKAYGF